MANHDPENRGRVRVALYWQGGGPMLWAPVASAHASAGFGLMTTPEIGDEVLVGFLDGDPERPAVLGSVWNGVHAGPRERYEAEHEAELAGNQVKWIVTKSGIRVHLVDTPGHESLTVATPRSNRLVMTEHAAETALLQRGRRVVWGLVTEQEASACRHSNGVMLKGNHSLGSALVVPSRD